MKVQLINGYFVCGNEHVAILIAIDDETNSHVFTAGDQNAYDQAACRACGAIAETKRSYIVEAVIPKADRNGVLFVDPEIRDQRLNDLRAYLASQFQGEPAHILKAAGAIGISLTEDQAQTLGRRRLVKAVRLRGRVI